MASKHAVTNPQRVLQDQILTSANPRDVSKINQNHNLAPDHSKQNQYDYLYIPYSFSLLALLLVNWATQFSFWIGTPEDFLALIVIYGNSHLLLCIMKELMSQILNYPQKKCRWPKASENIRLKRTLSCLWSIASQIAHSGSECGWDCS